MDISNLILSVAAILISVLTAFYSYRQINIAKWQSKMEYINSLRTWVFETLDTLVSISHLLVSENDEIDFTKRKFLLLDKLSSQIEKGRFYLPNIDKNDGYGKDKQTAYRGYRALTLDFLVLSYKLILSNDFFHDKRDIQKRLILTKKNFSLKSIRL